MSGRYAVPFDDPKPDFDALVQVLSGRRKPERVHYVELYADSEIVARVIEDFLQEKAVPSPTEDRDHYYAQQILFWHRMGYDYIRVSGGLDFKQTARRIADDTAGLSRGKRRWVEEGIGIISTWRDFEDYPWPAVEHTDLGAYEYVASHLPEGMKMLICPSSGVFEVASEYLLGFEGLSYLIYENPDLVKAVFHRVGELICRFYENALDIENVGGIFQGDDLGYKTATFLSPKHLGELVFPWHRKYAELAHARGQQYWLHSCGNLELVMDTLIDEVRIDALHSFQDEIMPVSEFMRAYGHRTGVLGGVDMDALCRMGEEDLRRHVRSILKSCAPGRYALGSGNSIANYVPLQNYLAMLDEGARWGA